MYQNKMNPRKEATGCVDCGINFASESRKKIESRGDGDAWGIGS